MKKSGLRVTFVVFVDAILFAVFALLLAIDRIVNNTLYDYGLVFSDNWAQPYWLMLRASMGLTVASIFLISIVELPHSIFDEKTELNKAPEEAARDVTAQDIGILEEEDGLALSPKPPSVSTKRRKKRS